MTRSSTQNFRALRRSWMVGLAATLMAAALVASVNYGLAEVHVPKVADLNQAAPVNWAGDLSPISTADWNYARAAHLLERAGFGGTPEEIHALAKLTPEQAVASLVKYESIDNSHLPKFKESNILEPGMVPYVEENGVRASIDDGHAKGKSSLAAAVLPEGRPLRLQPLIDEAYYHKYADAAENQRLALWWANRMLNTRHPLEEKISLFWHDHFATNYDRVGDYRKTQAYLETLHTHATGNFRDFVVAIAQDPCMLVYLDNGLNVKGHANENFGREVLELFTMGEGRGYTESDIREAARAFTGWTQDDTKFTIKTDLHDTDKKTIFGQTANFDGIEVIDLIMKQPATAQLIAQKLYNYFVALDMPPGVNDKLAQQLRDGKYEIKPLLTTLFLSKDFYSAHAYATQIKTPAHLIISTCKKLELTEVPGVPEFHRLSVSLGQELLAPPNVAGWEGGNSWINPATLLERGNFIHGMLGLTTPNSERGARRVAAAPRAARPGDMAAPPAEMPAGGADMPAGGMDQMSDPTAAPPARTMPAQGMGANRGAGGAARPGAANQMMDEQPNRYAATEEYVLATGVQRGRAKAARRVLPIPKTKAEVNFAAMAQAAGATNVQQVVDYFTVRFLRVTLDDQSREELVKYLRDNLKSENLDFNSSELETILRELTHMIMSMPEYQLS